MFRTYSFIVMACFAITFSLTSCRRQLDDKPPPTAQGTRAPASDDAHKVRGQPKVPTVGFADLAKKHIGSICTVRTTLTAIKSTGAENPSFGVFEDGRIVYRGVLLELSDTDILLRSATPPEKRVRVSGKHIRSIELGKV